MLRIVTHAYPLILSIGPVRSSRLTNAGRLPRGSRPVAVGARRQQPRATFTGPLARSLALVAIVIGGLMFMFGEGGAKRQISGIVFGGGLALFAAQFLDLAVLTVLVRSMRRCGHARRPTYRPVYKALHRPLTICGVDRRLFFLALLLGAATFNLFYSFLAGLLMFAGLYGFALWATLRDPEMLRILLASSRLRRRYDPGKHERTDMEVTPW
jgi:type IV secretory pathway VirB2 component (pilin)/type IV secretory pathway TrbD component